MLPGPVGDWKLETTVCEEYTLQIRHVSNKATGLWRTPVQEKWQRTKKLGQGGFGVVWLEQCTEGVSAGQVRAVKQIQTSFGNQTVTPKMLSSELSAIFNFSQKPVCSAPECIFITMEYLPLGDLENHISERLPEAQAQRITLQVLQGLAFMHRSKFAHRDLKPRNVLVQHQGPDWWVKISDFGTSKQVGTTVLRTVIGTEHYQAPEVRGIYRPCDLDDDDDDGDPSYDLAIDIWAVGAMAFRMTTGRVPFPGKKDLTRYVLKDNSFPAEDSLSEAYTAFITQTMRPSARDRPSAKKALESPWIREQLLDPQSSSLRSDETAGLPGSGLQRGYEASATWSSSNGLSDLFDDNSTTLRQPGPGLESLNGEPSKTARR
ncbi:kinase-like domain-containing protein [Ilyonectria robusta]|uniref:kinase-like domain-containing protein n=1 Tax=Ilyonectria robusta TaxID=1079257 RepID=UPI001E8CA55D|nr:kinase-like domain-containing protein [Ilyonectria robusta]KAH8665589.1 kinase-like domain-containing protein [Ilyonectria robusta]